jgi:uncharacterized membrane protein YdjX (TVP38/TMEM64 family)
MNKKFSKIIIFFLLFIGVITLAWYFAIPNYFTLERLKNDRAWLMELVDKNYISSVFVYLLFFVLIIAIGIPAVGPLTLLGGFLFGVWFGLVYALIGAIVGVTTLFLIVRYIIANTIRRRYAAQLNQFNTRVHSYGYSYLLTMHLMSVVPYFVIATVAGLTDVSVFTFIWTAAVGSLPLLAVYAFAGQQLGTIGSMRDILSPQIMLALVLLALLALLPILIRRVRETIETH